MNSSDTVLSNTVLILVKQLGTCTSEGGNISLTLKSLSMMRALVWVRVTPVMTSVMSPAVWRIIVKRNMTDRRTTRLTTNSLSSTVTDMILPDNPRNPSGSYRPEESSVNWPKIRSKTFGALNRKGELFAWYSFWHRTLSEPYNSIAGQK